MKKIVHLLTLLPLLIFCDARGNCDSTKTKICIQTTQSTADTIYNVSCFNLRGLLTGNQNYALKNGKLVGNISLSLEYDTNFNLHQSISGNKRYKYSYGSGKQVAHYSEQVLENANWTTTKETFYQYSSFDSIVTTITLIPNICSPTGNDSVVTSYYYDSLNRDTLYLTIKYRGNSIIEGNKRRTIYINNVLSETINYVWTTSNQAFLPSTSIRYTFNAHQKTTSAFNYYYQNGIAYESYKHITNYLLDTFLLNEYDLYHDVDGDYTEDYSSYTYTIFGQLKSFQSNGVSDSEGHSSYTYYDCGLMETSNNGYTTMSGNYYGQEKCHYYYYAITANSTLSDDDSVQLTASNADDYLWNTGATTPSIYVKNGGTYQCMVTNSSGCQFPTAPLFIADSGAIEFRQINTAVEEVNYSYNESTKGSFHSPSSLPIANISASGPLTFCGGGSVVLTSDSAYSYSWSPGGQTTKQITVTQGGKYTLTVYNLNGCTSSMSVIVTVFATPPSPPLLTIESGQYINVNNHYPVQWYLNGQAIPKVTYYFIQPKHSGLYSAKFLSDTLGTCSSGISAAIQFNYTPSMVSINLPYNKVFCATQASSASIGFSHEPYTGLPPYTWQWSPDSNLSHPTNYNTTFTKKVTGWYKLTVTDSLGHIAVDSIFVEFFDKPPKPVITSTHTTFCTGGMEEKISTTPGYSYYDWTELYYNNNAYTSINENAFIKQSGSFVVQVYDTNGCASDTSLVFKVEMINPDYDAKPRILGFGIPVNCGGNGAGIYADTLVGNSYFWVRNNIDTLQGVSIFPAQSGSNYSLYASDSHGCISVSYPFQVSNSNLPIVIKGPYGDRLCVNETVALTTNYDPSFHYTWYNYSQAIPNSDTNTIYATNSGNYSVQVNSTGGCTGDNYINLNQSFTYNPGLMYYKNKLYAFSLGSGNVQWYRNSVLIPGATQDTITPSSPGIYKVVATNYAGCPGSASFNYTCGITFEKNILDCSNACSNKIKVTSQGRCPFTYNWSNNWHKKNQLNLCSGNYYLVQKDRLGCISKDSISIGSTFGTAIQPVIEIAGGNYLHTTTNYSPMQWYLNGSEIIGATNSDFYPTVFGTYTVKFLSNDSICTQTSKPFVFSLLQMHIPDSSITICDYDSTKEIGLQNEPSTGVSQYSYKWYPSNGLTDSTARLTQIRNPMTGWYTLTVTDGLGQVAKDSVYVNISTVPTPFINSSKGNFICDGDSTLLTTNNDTTLQFLWLRNGQILNTSLPNSAYADSGLYTVQVTNAQGCTRTESSNITPIKAPILNLNYNDPNLIVSANVPVAYQWYLDSLPILGAQGDSISLSAQGIYTISATNSIGCKSTKDYSFICSVNLTTDFTSCFDSCSWNITAHSSGIMPFSYHWSNTSTSKDLQNMCPGNYTLVQTDKQGCTVRDSVILINQPTSIVIDSLKNANCAGCANGEAYFSGSGSYFILYPMADTSYTNSFMNLPADTFALCAIGATGCSSCRTIIIQEDPLALSTINNPIAEMTVYPNPFTTKTSFIFAQEENYDIHIMDILSREVILLNSAHKKSVILDRGNLTAGIYFYSVRSKSGIVANGKIIIE